MTALANVLGLGKVVKAATSGTSEELRVAIAQVVTTYGGGRAGQRAYTLLSPVIGAETRETCAPGAMAGEDGS